MNPLAAITGATAGIGREFAEQLAARGYDLLLTARTTARLDQLAAELRDRHGIAVELFPGDLSRDAEITALAQRLASETRLRLLVNNAGFGTRGTLAETDPSLQDAMLHLHVIAPMRLTQAVLPGLLARRSGGVINLASVAAFLVSPRNVNYCASKAYLVAFSQGVAAEVRGTGVVIQALCPGFTRTEFHQRMGLEPAEIRGPGWLWLPVDRVVRASLRAFERGGPVVCIPSGRYRVLAALARLTPNALLTRLSA